MVISEMRCPFSVPLSFPLPPSSPTLAWRQSKFDRARSCRAHSRWVSWVRGSEIPCVLGTSSNSVASSSQHCPFIFLSPPSQQPSPLFPLPRALEPRNSDPDSPPSHARGFPAKCGAESTRVCPFNSPSRRWFPQILGQTAGIGRIETLNQTEPESSIFDQ
jgi:hypothetical protein